MKQHRLGILVAGLLITGTASAVAQTQTPTITDLARGKFTGPISIDVKDTSDVVMNRVVYDANGVGNTWHSHPLHYVTVKTGSITIHRGDANGCTSKTYTAGQSYEEPAGAHVHEGSLDVSLYVTYVGVPVGGAIAKDETAPTGPNCPSKLTTGLARTELSRSTIQGASSAATTGDSEMFMQAVTVPGKTNFRSSWYSSPAALYASTKSGALTVYTASGTSCTSKTYAAGQGLFVPKDQAIFVRNEGSAPAEVYATRLGLPVGAAPRVDAPNPGGANCPDISAAATPAPATNLPRTGGPAGALLLLGFGMTGVGTVLRGVTRRR